MAVRVRIQAWTKPNSTASTVAMQATSSVFSKTRGSSSRSA